MAQPKMLQPVPDAAKSAREQAKAYKSVFGPRSLELGDGSIIDIPPHPNLRMLDDEQMAAYEELLFEVESYDREPDLHIPEQKLDSGVILPAETRRGAVLEPHRLDGKLVKPPYTVRVVQAAVGDDLYARLRAGGCNAADVWRVWNEQGLELTSRADADPKSNGSPGSVAHVPAPDQQ